MLAMTTPEMIFAAVGLAVGIGVVLLYGVAIGRGAKAKAQLILDEAQRNADAKVKDAEVALKEVELKREAEAERALSKSREKIHQRERQLDKRESGMQQLGDEDDAFSPAKLLETLAKSGERFVDIDTGGLKTGRPS